MSVDAIPGGGGGLLFNSVGGRTETPHCEARLCLDTFCKATPFRLCLQVGVQPQVQVHLQPCCMQLQQATDSVKRYMRQDRPYNRHMTTI
jgi:hypothetical protein